MDTEFDAPVDAVVDASVMPGYRILVPLDGSEVAEQALPVAEAIAHALQGSILLARITPLTTWAFAVADPLIPSKVYEQILADEERVAHAYVEQVARKLRARGVRTHVLVQCGEPAEKLLNLVPRCQIGLVVMTTHGRTGLARATLGSVADQLLRDSHVPLLLVRATQSPLAPACLDQAVIPLDGSERAESALSLASQLAGTLIRHLVLVRVVAAADSQAFADATRYLDQQRRRLHQETLGRQCQITAEVMQGDPATCIAARAQQNCHLVVMATRGETGMKRSIHGSVADHLLRHAGVPLLLSAPPRPPLPAHPRNVTGT